MSNYVRRAILPEVGEIVDADVVVDANDNDEQSRLNGPEDVLKGDITRTVSGDPALYAASNQLASVFKQALDNPAQAGNQENWGTDVKISGDGIRVVGGMPGHNVAAGAVAVYSRSGETWSHEQTITNPNPVSSDNFGETIAIDHTGTRIAVAAPGADLTNNQAGRVYVFSRSGTTWSLEQEVTVASFGQTFLLDEEFGSGGLSFDEDATKLVVGSPRHAAGGGSGVEYGSMHTFTRSVTTWSNQTYIPNPNGSRVFGEAFGTRPVMSADGSTIVTQAPLRTVNGGIHAGQVCAYRWDTDISKWVFVKNSENPVVAYGGSTLATTHQQFGASPVLSETGSIMVCGSPFFASLGSQNGGLHLYMNEAGPIMGPQYVDGHGYPYSAGTTIVACSSVATSWDASFIVGGIPRATDTYTWEGKVIEYKREGRKLVPQGLIDAPVLSNTTQRFGEWVDVSADGLYWVASVHNWADAGFTEEGKVCVFKREKDATTITLPNLDVGSKVIRTK